jgi:hypothetical protein
MRRTSQFRLPEYHSQNAVGALGNSAQHIFEVYFSGLPASGSSPSPGSTSGTRRLTNCVWETYCESAEARGQWPAAGEFVHVDGELVVVMIAM